MLFFLRAEPFRLTMERGKIQSMTPPLTAEDIAPLIASLTPQERVRLFRLVTLPNLPNHRDAAAYESAPPAKDEFPVEDEPLAWDSDGWEEVERNVGRSDGTPSNCPTSGDPC